MAAHATDHSIETNAPPQDLERSTAKRLVGWLDQRLYSGFGERWDIELFTRILRTHALDQTVLDLGAGRGHLAELDLRDVARRVCGADPDEIVLSNPQLDEARVLRDATLPYPDETFDLVFSTHVWEHVDRPVAFLREASRVLKPGGLYLSLTPNRWHYVGLIASATPHALHGWFNALRGRDHVDTFPTFHRLNTRRAIRRFAVQAGFDVSWIQAHEHRPEYLRFSALAYLLGAAWERTVNSSPRFADLRVSLVACLRKPESDDAGGTSESVGRGGRGRARSEV